MDQVIEKFQSLCGQYPKAAVDWYYDFSQNTNYIQRYRIAKCAVAPLTGHGDLDITIILSKLYDN